MNTSILSRDARSFFLLGMRVFFGVWLLYVGLVKWISIGPSAFTGFIAAEFDKTWSPHALNVALAWIIIVTEPLFGAWILSGWKPRLAWAMTALLMFQLVMGQTLLKKPEVIANWEYLVLTLACAALAAPSGARPRD